MISACKVSALALACANSLATAPVAIPGIVLGVGMVFGVLILVTAQMGWVVWAD